MVKHKFEPPTDVRAWWRSACCSEATADTTKDCGFCGRNVLGCAKEHTEFLEHATTNQLRKYAEDQLGAGHGGDMPCGGSGFWCHKCGRFWAQDSCGGSGWGAEHSSDGQPLSIEDATDTDKMQLPGIESRVSCVCGTVLFYLLPDGWEPEGGWGANRQKQGDEE